MPDYIQYWNRANTLAGPMWDGDFHPWGRKQVDGKFQIIGAQVMQGERDRVTLLFNAAATGTQAGFSVRFRLPNTGTWTNATETGLTNNGETLRKLTFTPAAVLTAEHIVEVEYQSGAGNIVGPAPDNEPLEDYPFTNIQNRLDPVWSTQPPPFTLTLGVEMTPYDLNQHTDNVTNVYSFSEATTNQLPNGITLSSQGILSGTPLSISTTSVAFNAAAPGGGVAASDPSTWTIQQPPTFAGPDIPDIEGVEGSPITPVDAGSRFQSSDPMSFEKAGTTWPSWAVLSASGIISGTPTAASATVGHTVRAFNSLGQAFTNGFAFLIAGSGQSELIDSNSDFLVDSNGDNLVGVP